MTRVFVLTTVATIIFSVLLIGMRQVANWTRSTATAILDSGACEQPCWHQIQVGQPTLERARAMLLADHQLTIMDQVAADSGTCAVGWTAPGYSVKKGCLSAAGLNADSIVRLIIIYPDQSFRLGDAFTMFGAPLIAITCAFSDPALAMMYQGSVYLYFPGNVEVV